MKFTLILAIAAVVAVGVNRASAAAIGFNPTTMLCAVNKFRVSRKLPPLGLDDSLNRAAQEHSVLQARTNTMSHSLTGEPGLMERCSIKNAKWSSVSENVAMGQQSIDQVMQSWINSPNHLKNLLSNATHFGSGMALNSKGNPYWTQDFGRDDKKPKNNPC